MNHRNSQKRLHVDEGIFAITVNTKDRYPFFQEQIFCDVFIEQLRLCKQVRKFRLYGFALMHDHFHMLIHPDEGENISRVMHFLKRHVSREINIFMGYERNPHATHGAHQDGEANRLGEDIDPRLQEGVYAISESGDRYPRLLNTPKFSWQSSFHDHLIRNEHDFKNQLDYIWWNPEKHGIAKDFREYSYSSFENHQDLIDSF